LKPSDEEAKRQGCYFDPKPAERVRTFLHKFCRQSIGDWAGKPLNLLDWQWAQIIKPLYGWRKPDGTRRFRQAGIWVPKSNGKSTLMSGLSLYHLIADGEQGAQVVNLAATVEQAGIVFREACNMVEQSPDLDKLLWVRKNIKTIEYGKTRSTLKVMSGERGGGKHGFSISCLIFDELAEQADRLLWDTMRHNVAKRKNSLLISISTAGFRRESIGFEQFQYAQKVLAGEIVDTAFLPAIYAAPEDADWTSLETFKQCNPSFGVTIDEQEVKETLTEAKNEPRKEAAYKTLRLNLWTGFATNWISSMSWDACQEDFKEEEFHGKDVFIGLDYGYKRDLCSYVLLAKKDGLVYLMPRFFIPEKMAEQKQRKDRVPYLTWAMNAKANLHLTEGDVIDPAYIRKCLVEDSERFRFSQVGFDPTGMEESRQILEREHNFEMISVPQRAKYIGPAAAYFERLIMSKEIRHPGNPVLSWCLENCSTKETPDGIYVYKHTETQRIDGIIATVIGLSLLMVAQEELPQFVVF
jgi:phage terminase large subunit-like protein